MRDVPVGLGQGGFVALLDLPESLTADTAVLVASAEQKAA